MPKYANLPKYAKICQNAKPIIFMPNPLKKCQISGIWHKICQGYHPCYRSSKNYHIALPSDVVILGNPFIYRCQGMQLRARGY